MFQGAQATDETARKEYQARKISSQAKLFSPAAKVCSGNFAENELMTHSLNIHISRFFKLASFLLLACPSSLYAQTLTPVSLELRWHHQFQFAGYYAALHKGFYLEAGLDVTLKEGGPEANPVQGVLSGRSEFGIALSSLVVNFLNGQPVRLLGPIFQHSPNILLVRGKDRRLVDLVNTSKPKIALMNGDQDVDLKSMFLNEGIALERLNFVADERHLHDLLNQRVTAVNAYTSNEPYLLDKLDVPYTVLKPATYGMDFYGDVLFTHRDVEQKRPQVVAAFYAASKRGWQYALDHPDEIIDLIQSHYNTQKKSREHLAFEAKALHDLINPEVIEIGHNNPGRWKHIAATYARFGVVNDQQALDEFFYQPERRIDLTWFYWTLAGLAGVTLILGGIAFYIHRVNRRLAIAIEEKTRTEAQLLKSEAWHRVVFETTPSAGIVWRPGFVLSAWNRQAEALFGWHREEVIGRSFGEFLITETDKPTLLPRLLHTNAAGEWELLPHSINDNLTRDGHTITCEWFNAWLPDRPGEPRTIISLATDITERHRLEQQIEQLAFYDPLTELPNRRLLFDRFDQAQAAAKRSGLHGALIFIDLDNFKPLNDQHGHEAGDQLLIEVARRLKECVRSADTTARLGGDEFVVMLAELDTDPVTAITLAKRVARNLLERLGEPYHLPDKTNPRQPIAHRCSASLGVTLFDSQCSQDDVIRRADDAMYHSKSSGRNCLMVDGWRPG